MMKPPFVGTYDAFYESIDNNMIEDRHSMLAELLNPENEIKKASTIAATAPEPEYVQQRLPFVDAYG